MTARLDRANPDTEERLLHCLREHGLLEAANIQARVIRGVAYLDGSVWNWSQKRMAGELCRTLRGIRAVVNMLRVRPLPIMDDASLKKGIRRMLAGHPNIDRVSLQVVYGVVRLSGCVPDEAEKRRVEGKVWAMPGVRHVVSTLQVGPSTATNDLQIVNEILKGLAGCLGLDISTVTVKSQGGTVRLSGTVPNHHLRSAAEDLACWMPLVHSVVNELECPVSAGR
jgi:osmotically-inducible protein OsmY